MGWSGHVARMQNFGRETSRDEGTW